MNKPLPKALRGWPHAKALAVLTLFITMIAGPAGAQSPLPAGLNTLLQGLIAPPQSAQPTGTEPTHEGPAPAIPAQRPATGTVAVNEEPGALAPPAELEPISGSDAEAALEAYLLAVAYGEVPAVPGPVPAPGVSYQDLQGRLIERDALIALGTRVRPTAPARGSSSAPSSPAPKPAQRSTDAATGGATPFPGARPSDPPVHVMLTDTPAPGGHLTVFPDGSRAVVARNVKAPTGQKLPTVDPTCPARLRALGVRFSSVPSFVKQSGCQKQGVVEVTHFGSGVALNPNVHVTCEVAEAMALWLRNAVQGEAMRSFGSPVVKLSNTHGYSCRFRSGGKVSEHGFANAIDIGTFHLADGRKLSVLENWHPDGTPFGNRAARWFEAVNKRACDYFQLVLNPRSDKAHANHFHFDMGPWKSCD